MITIRDHTARGASRLGWLDSRHTFSFAEYHDPKNMGFRSLRVINDDRVSPGAGFPSHSHRDMDIISYVLEGALAHKDSLGNGTVIRPGEVQRMSAGSGIVHSEFNPSKLDPVHFLQIWIIPERRGMPPSYEQKDFRVQEPRATLQLVAADGGRDGALMLHEDAQMYAGTLAAGARLVHKVAPGRGVWVHVARGNAALNGTEMKDGDGAAVEDETAVTLEAHTASEILLFDLK
jgi:quercetin 2,3-dioxygenase